MARFGSLPHAVQVHIFGLLPMDVRLRCIEVCRGWRLALQDTAAWRHLAVPDCEYTGVNPYLLLRAALARTGGQLETLDVSHLEAYDGFLEYTLFKDNTLLAPKQTRLRELRVGPADFHGLIDVLAITGSAPQLQQLTFAAQWSEWYDSAAGRFCHQMDRFRGTLRIRTLGLDLNLESIEDDDELYVVFARIRRLVRKLTNPEFSALYVDFDVLDDDILGFVADLAAAHDPPLLVLGLEQYEDWPALSFDNTARLLRLNALRQFDSRFWVAHLQREDRDDGSDDAAVWTEICAAVRDCTSLRTVVLDPRLGHVSARAARQLAAALAGHPSVACIVPDDTDFNEPPGMDCACSVEYSRGLAEIAAANAPALRRIDLCDVGLVEDGGLGQIFRAVAHNTHLKELAIGSGGESCGWYIEPDDQRARSLWTLDLIRDWLMPALRSCRSLRKLKIATSASMYYWGPRFDEVDEDDEYSKDELLCQALQAAEALVCERRDPKVLAAARGWERAYCKWTSSSQPLRANRLACV